VVLDYKFLSIWGAFISLPAIFLFLMILHKFTLKQRRTITMLVLLMTKTRCIREEMYVTF